MKKVLALVIIIFVFFVFTSASVYSQGTQIRNLPAASSVNSGDMFPGDAFAGGTYKYTFSQLFGARTITCTAPLLCDGGSSMTLGSDRTLSLQTISVNPKDYGAVCNGVTNDATAIDTAWAALIARGGGRFEIPTGRCIYNGTGLTLSPPVGVTFASFPAWSGVHVIIQGQGRNSSAIKFTGCSNTQCVLLQNLNSIGSGYNSGSGVRDITLNFPSGKKGVYLNGLEEFNVSNIHFEGGTTALTIGDSRGGKVDHAWITQWTANGIELSGENYISNVFANIVLVNAGTATGSGIVYAKTTASAIDGVYFRGVTVNGTSTGPAFAFSTVTAMPMYGWFTDCVADGTFGAGFSFTNFSDIYITQPWSISHGTNSVGMKFDNTDNVSILGGELWAGDSGGSDIYLLNSVNKFSFLDGALAGGVTSVKVDSTTHDARIRPRYVIGSTLSNDITKIVPSTVLRDYARTIYTGTTTATMLGMNQPGAANTIYQRANSSGNLEFIANDGTTILETITQAGKVSIGATSPPSPLTITTNAAVLPTPVAGTLLQIGSADSTASRLGIQSFGFNGAIDFYRTDGTNASPTAIGGTVETIGQIGGFGYDGSAITSSNRGSMQINTDGAWSGSSTPTAIRFNTTLSGTVSSRAVLSIDNAGHLITQGTAPTVACTGTGTSPSAPTITGTDLAFKVVINTGTGSPASTGTCTVTYAAGYSTNNPIWACTLISGASNWGNGATIQITTESLTAPVFTWANLVGGAATGLATSTSYKFSCINVGRL